MKTLKLICLALLATPLFCACSSDDDVNNETSTEGEMPAATRAANYKYTSSVYFDQERPSDAYWYPCYPGMSAWSSFIKCGMDSVLLKLTVPQARLKVMSTAGLVQTLLDNPYSTLYWSMSTSAFGDFFNWMNSKFETSMKYLEKKDDAAKTIVDFYSNIDFSKNGQYTFSISTIYDALNVLLTPNKEFYLQLTDSEKAKLLEIVAKKHEEYTVTVNTDDLSLNVIVLEAQLMVDLKYEPFIDKYGDDINWTSFYFTLLLNLTEREKILEIAATYK